MRLAGDSACGLKSRGLTGGADWPRPVRHRQRPPFFFPEGGGARVKNTAGRVFLAAVCAVLYWVPDYLRHPTECLAEPKVPTAVTILRSTQ